MSEPAPRDRSPAEAWVPAAVAQVLAEGARFAATFVAFITKPRISAERWAAGGSTFMNPLGFVATAAAVYWAVANGAAALWPVAGADPEDSIFRQISSAIGPHVHYGLLGVAMHAVLRALGSGRPVAASVGVSFYAGGSAGTVLALLMVAVAQYTAHTLGSADIQSVGGGVMPAVIFGTAVLAYAFLCLVLARAMIGVHMVPGWKAGVGIASGILLTALLFGTVLPEGSYGWHPFLSLSGGGGFSISYGFRS